MIFSFIIVQDHLISIHIKTQIWQMLKCLFKSKVILSKSCGEPSLYRAMHNMQILVGIELKI